MATNIAERTAPTEFRPMTVGESRSRLLLVELRRWFRPWVRSLRAIGIALGAKKEVGSR